MTRDPGDLVASPPQRRRDDLVCSDLDGPALRHNGPLGSTADPIGWRPRDSRIRLKGLTKVLLRR